MDIRSGPWDRKTIAEFLTTTAIPLRIATAGAQAPLVQSAWYLYEDDALWCCTQADSVLVSRLRRRPACGFEIAADAPPYRGVRGQGVADIEPARAADLLPRLMERYLGTTQTALGDWLLARLEAEVAIRIGDLSVATFDYSRRMA